MADDRDDPEVWLPVRDYADLYDVSNLGRVRRIATGLVLTPIVDRGYPCVSLSSDGNVQKYKVSRLVLTSFCGRAPFDGAHAAHNDGNPLNSRLSNLRWATPLENQADVDRHGRRRRGEEVYGAVLKESDVREIRRRIQSGQRNRPIAEAFDVSISTIHLIRHAQIWKHVA